MLIMMFLKGGTTTTTVRTYGIKLTWSTSKYGAVAS